MKTTLKAAGGRWCLQSARDRAVTDGWNAHGAGEYPGANPWLTDQPEHYHWRDGWTARNEMAAKRQTSQLILFVAVGRNRASARLGTRSIIEATVRAAGSRATGRLTATGFAAGTADRAGVYRTELSAEEMDGEIVTPTQRYNLRMTLCVDGYCHSPTACDGFGYCRSRNTDGPLSAEEAEPFRREWRKLLCGQ